MPPSVSRATRSAASGLAALTIVTGLAACSSNHSLNQAQIVAKADAICLAEVKASEAIPTPKNLHDVKAAAAYFDQTEAIVNKATYELVALTPDHAIAAKWITYIRLRADLTVLLREITNDADHGNKAYISLFLNQVPSVSAAAGSAAGQVGAQDCVE